MKTPHNESNQERNYIAFFDLDGTLINANSGVLLIRQAYRDKLMTTADILRALWLLLLFRLKITGIRWLTVKMISHIRGKPAAYLEKISSGELKEILISSISGPARDETYFHSEKRAAKVILSSSLEPCCRPVGEYLNFNTIICSELETVEGKFTGATRGKLCFGEEKAERLRDYCALLNINPGDCWYYGDSATDLPVLKSVGHPVCVNPEKKLRRFAAANGWKVVSWK